MKDRDNGGSNEQGSLGLWSVISIIVGIVIGASIFKVPGLIFSNTSDPWAGILLWAFCGVLALIGALCYAELATTYPRAGGDYVYLTRAYGPWCGFLFGWAQLSIILPTSIGAMAYVFGEFATVILKLEDYTGLGLTSEFSYAFLAVTVIALLNVIGVTLGKLAQNILVILKLIGLLAIVVVGFGWAESKPMDWPHPAATTIHWGALAIILVLYAYGGWNDAAFVAAEVRNPKRNIPLALLVGVGVITVAYVLVNTAYLTGLGFDGVKPGPDKLPVPTQLLGKAFGEYGAKAMSVIVMISALGAVNGLTFAGARVYATLGNDHPLFSWLGFWRPGHGAPILAVIVQALITLAMVVAVGTSDGTRVVNEALSASSHWIHGVFETVGLGNYAPPAFAPVGDWDPDRAFNLLFAHGAPAFWLFFLATGFSLFTLRTRDAALPRPFTVPLYPILPFIFCCMCIYMLYKSTLYVVGPAEEFNLEHPLFALPLVLIGLPLYWLSRAIGYHGLAEQ
jgi:basic amino acid/polyamine antiporter, APA family